MDCRARLQRKKTLSRKDLRLSWRKMDCRAGDRGLQCNPSWVWATARVCATRSQAMIATHPSRVDALPSAGNYGIGSQLVRQNYAAALPFNTGAVLANSTSP